MIEPYYKDENVTLYHGDSREIVPELSKVNAVITDPPYGETALEWDTWPDGWPELAATVSDCLWCFGSMRMFLTQRDEFKSWKLAQDVIWEKQNGSSFATDRFKRVHEMALHYYRGKWGDLHNDTPKVDRPGPEKKTIRKRSQPKHMRGIGEGAYVDDGTRLQRSVIPANSRTGYMTNETQKPEAIVAPLMHYSVPLGGTVLDMFAGSGTTLAVAVKQGKKAIGIESRESQCESIVERLRQRELILV